MGGITTRLVYELCSFIRPYVKKILLFGSPNLGITQTPYYSSSDQNEEEKYSSGHINYYPSIFSLLDKLEFIHLSSFYEMLININSVSQVVLPNIMKLLTFEAKPYEDLELFVNF